MNRQAGSMGDELTNAAIIGLLALVGLTLLLRGAGTIAAWISGAAPPTGGPTSGIGVILDPADPGSALGAPGLSAIVYWIVATILLGVVGLLVAIVWVRLRRYTLAVESDPRRMAGTATRHDTAALASAKALLRRAASLRPSLTNPQPHDVGYQLGTSKGTSVWASVEDSIMVIGPPRSGKGLHLVIPAILDAPGAVVVTSTRPDNLTVTMRARAKTGPVAIFDPQRLAAGLPAGLRWSPIRGCESPQTAMIRATGLPQAPGYRLGASIAEGSGKARPEPPCRACCTRPPSTTAHRPNFSAGPSIRSPRATR